MEQAVEIFASGVVAVFVGMGLVYVAVRAVAAAVARLGTRKETAE